MYPDPTPSIFSAFFLSHPKKMSPCCKEQCQASQRQLLVTQQWLRCAPHLHPVALLSNTQATQFRCRLFETRYAGFLSCFWIGYVMLRVRTMRHP